MRKWIPRILRSKTMVFNLVAAALIALEASFSLLQPHIDGNVFVYSSIVLTVVNAMLRVVTHQALKDK